MLTMFFYKSPQLSLRPNAASDPKTPALLELDFFEGQTEEVRLDLQVEGRKVAVTMNWTEFYDPFAPVVFPPVGTCGIEGQVSSMVFL